VLRCRPSGETDFAFRLLRFGVAVYRDDANGLLWYLSEAGSLAVVADRTRGRAPAEPAWRHSPQLKARRADEKDFTGETAHVAAEVYHESVADVLLYVTEAGALAAVPRGDAPATVQPRNAPKWLGGPARVRDGWRVGFELFEDSDGGRLLAVTDRQSLAAPPAPPRAVDDGPRQVRAFELAVRRPGEEADRAVAARLYDAGGLRVLVTEAGGVALLP
jgi:hypothetical protein